MLVITIIVLLILAGVSIAILTGDNGILNKANQAKEETEKASKNEQKILEQMGQQIKGEFYINTIEDLVDFSTNVANGNSYSGAKVILERNLDFKDDNSYENPQEKFKLTEKGYVRDENGEEIKTLLTSGSGWFAIGYKEHENYFSGTFDGNGHVLSNLYVNGKTGLFFATHNAKIANLKISGELTFTGKVAVGAIVAVAYNTTIENCETYCNIDSTVEYETGGIAGILYGSTVSNSTNYGNIQGAQSSIGGIVGSLSGNIGIATVQRCTNIGNVLNKGNNNQTTNCGGIARN